MTLIDQGPCQFCQSTDTEPLRGLTFCNDCGKLYQVFKDDTDFAQNSGITWADATPEQISAARKTLARQHHGNDTMMQEINVAHDLAMKERGA